MHNEIPVVDLSAAFRRRCGRVPAHGTTDRWHLHGDRVLHHHGPRDLRRHIGDLLMRWTNDRWVSNVHRVAEPPSNACGAKRLSMAFFHHPNYDAMIECEAPSGRAKYPPVLSGEYRDLKYRQTRLMQTAIDATA